MPQSKKTQQEKVEFIKNFKEQPCADCGVQYPHYVMDLHHTVEKGDTYHRNSNTRRMMRYSYDRIKEELDQCVVLCANCHRIRHHGEGAL